MFAHPHIIIADDHSMIRKGIKLLLVTQFGYKNIYEVNSCNELFVELKRTPATHLVLDIIFADGTAMEVIATLRQLYPELKIMIFSMQLPEVYAEVFRNHSIHYFLEKSTNEDKTVSYLRKFFSDEPPPNRNPFSTTSKNNPFTLLSPRELEILHYMLNGHKTNVIAQNLNLSNSTVSTIKRRIFEKTDTNSVAQVLELAMLYNINY